jgi:hypothetical protein
MISRPLASRPTASSCSTAGRRPGIPRWCNSWCRRTTQAIGENNVNNTYYYIGQNTAGTGPTDSFTGGTGSGWNVAILPDAQSNYTISTSGGITTLANTGDPAHAGSLAVSNVQALAFAPTSDPSSNPGSLTATGDTLDIIGPLPSSGDSITISNGAKLELATPDTGGTTSVAFAGSTGTFQIDLATFGGTVSGFGGQDGIDIRSLAFAGNTTPAYTPNGGTPPAAP